ncbi:MAG: 3-methyl-2-oxobutanoate hydroxymethyltransferase [Pseudomonadota bacterium]|jgi:3-methyl-2-oxobutanoate hydroxymethyltransferase
MTQNLSHTGTLRRTTLRDLQKRVDQGQRLAMLTAYDTITATLIDRAGVDLILVGDSLGNVVLGFDTTIPVRMDDMIRHTAAVVRGTSQALVVFDLPFGTTTDPDTALRHSIRAFQETGCQAVKLEGDERVAPIVQRLTQNGIPVMAHIGLTPQSVHQLGGYYRHGKSSPEIERLKNAARALEASGAFAIVLECVVDGVAAEISQELRIPTIGIGSGKACDGQVLVINDLIGLSVQPPPAFAKPRAQVAEIIERCAREFIAETREAPLQVERSE